MCRIMFESGESNPNIYYPHYELILGCNAVLDYIGQVNDTPQMINKVLAQAYALRGFLYFRLVNIFGQPYQMGRDAIGVPLKVNSYMQTTSITRKTVGECYDQILSDLLQAERLYKTLSGDYATIRNDGRTSLPMVELMLSRVYLYMENWTKAAEYAKKVMDNSRFSLYNLNNTPLTNDRGYPNSIDMHNYGATNEIVWVYGNMEDMLSWVNHTNVGTANHPFFMASPDLLNSFAAGDLRKSLYIARDLWMYNGEYMPCAFGKFAMQEGEKFYLTLKEDFSFGRSLRLSEAYLNYIEANTMLYKENGNTSAGAEAVVQLNELRRHRFTADEYQPVSFTSADLQLEFVKAERRRELCFEDHRWYDLRRWGMPEIRHIWYDGPTTATEYVLNANDPSYTCPIPDEALEANSHLTQVPLGTIPRTGTAIN